MTSHLVALGGGWSVWRTMMVRTAGFPAARVLELASDKLVPGLEVSEGIYEAEVAAIAARLRTLTEDPRFREALTWQSRNALVGVERLLASPSDARNSKARQRERLVASYLQRYCVKNDTIGFFGPVGWGRLATDAPPIVIADGENYLAARSVYFESWAIDALAAVASDDAALRPDLRPRRMPGVAVAGQTVRYGRERQIEVPALVADLLAGCDGEVTARELAQTIRARHADDVGELEEIYALLEELAEQQLVTWAVELPSSISHPERALRQQLSGLAAAEPYLTALDALEAGRDAVSAAAGDPPQLLAAITALEAAFEANVGTAASRRAGQTYAGRSLIYEDSRRDLDVTFGGAWLARFAPAMELVAQAARWFTFEIARLYREAFVHAHAQLGGDHSAIPYTQFWSAVAPLFDDPAIVRGVADEMARRWERVLASDAPTAVQLSSAQLAPAVAEQFAAPMAGWPGARHVAPDVMIAARTSDPDSVATSPVVLGEVHIGNTIVALFALQQAADGGAELVANMAADFSHERVYPVDKRELVTRADAVSRVPRDVHLELGPSRSWKPAAQVLRVEDLWVERHGGSLTVVDRRGGRSFDVIAFVEQYLTAVAGGAFHVGPRHAAHSPRVTIDDVIVSRERWVLDTAPLVRATHKASGLQQLLAVHRWAREHGIPRWIFVKVPTEPKPVYVDLASPVYVELLVTLVRGASTMSLSEMLPRVHETWLPGWNHEPCSSEFRMVMVDPAPWAPAT